MTDNCIVLKSADQTREFGSAIGRIIAERAIIVLSGPLGAGKTTLAQGIATGLGIAELVTSPTFTMMNEYDSGRLPLYHLDLYRLEEAGSSGQPAMELPMLAAELEEILQAPGVVLVEWAEYFADFFSDLDRLEIILQYGTPAVDRADEYTPNPLRQATFRALGANAARIVEILGPITN